MILSDNTIVMTVGPIKAPYLFNLFRSNKIAEHTSNTFCFCMAIYSGFTTLLIMVIVMLESLDTPTIKEINFTFDFSKKDPSLSFN